MIRYLLSSGEEGHTEGPAKDGSERHDQQMSFYSVFS